MEKNFKLHFCLVFLILGFALQAQLSEKGFDRVNISIEGKEFSDVTSITEDLNGYIWIGTDVGLLRYNGFEYKRYHYNENDSTSLHNNDIKCLHLEDNGNLWIGTAAGLSRYDQHCDCFVRYPSTAVKSSPTDLIADIISDKNGHLWIAEQSGGLYRYDKEKEQFIRFLHPSGDSSKITQDIIYVLLADRENNIWIGTGFGNRGTGLLRFQPSTGDVKRFVHSSNDKHSLLDNRISALFEDQVGQLFVGTYKCGFHLYNRDTETFDRLSVDSNRLDQLHAPYLEDRISGFGLNAVEPFVSIIHQDKNGGYWIGTSGKGINHFERGAIKPTFYAHEKTKLGGFTQNNYFRSFKEDGQGGIWIGFEGGVLYRKDIYGKKFIFHPETSASEIVYESTLNPGIIWAGSEGGGLRKMNVKTGELTTYLHDEKDGRSIGHNSVRIVYQEDPNTLWVGMGSIGGDDGGEDGRGGLDRMDIATGTFKHFKIRPEKATTDFSHTVYTICEDKKGHLWMGTGSGGVYRSNRDKTEFRPFVLRLPDSTLINPVVYDIKGNSRGNVWINDVELEGDGTTYEYDVENNVLRPFLTGFEATNLLEDKKGWYWISTWQKGTIHYNPADQTYQQFSVEDGLGSNLANYIVEGEDENTYWICTRFGLSKLNALTREITPIKLPVDRFYYGAFKGSDGQLFFSTFEKGLVSFLPDQIEGNPIPPKTVISNFLISDVPFKAGVLPDATIHLAYHQNDISIEYAGLHYSNSSKNRHQYKLTPVNNNWINAGANRVARYPNLGPGTYLFEVKAANSDGVWNKEAVSLSFIIAPPWWRTWWAYSILALVIFSILYFLFRFQLSRKLEQEEANRLKELDTFKTRFYANITHEFRTPLTVIQGMAEQLEEFPTEEPQKKISLIKKNSTNLLKLVNQMLELSKLQAKRVKLDVYQQDIIIFLKYLVETHVPFAQMHQVGLYFFADEQKLMMDFDAQKLEHVLVNLISNSIKFTPKGGKILVVAKKANQKNKSLLEIVVKDNGIGISKEQLPFIFDRFHQTNPFHVNQGTGIGLALVKELMEVMNATISVESELNKGTTFSLHFPIHNQSSLVSQQLTYEFRPIELQEANIAEKIPNSNDELPVLLIIEDNLDVTYYLQTCLHDQYQILTSQNGKDGIERAFETVPDIIISDVMMPLMDGYKVCATLKTDDRTNHIPIILLTARAAMNDKLTGLTQGADAYLVKPFEKEELLILLNNLLETRKTLQKKYSSTLLSSEESNKEIQNGSDSFIKKAETIILSHLSEESFSIHELAHELHLSRSQVHRKIKALTNMSTAIYIRHIRLQKAKELLSSSELNVSEIAYQTGFKSPVYFSQVFKENFGVSPSATRK